MELKPIFSDDSDYLEHYGVPGMKWGVRHDRERTGRRRAKSMGYLQAKRAGHRMNSNEAAKARLKGYANIERQEYERYKNKREKALSKGKTKKAERMSRKMAGRQEVIDRYNKRSNELSRDTAKLKKRIEKSGVAKVSVSKVPRSTLSSGEQYMNYVAFGATQSYLMDQKTSVVGNKYKVSRS